MSGVDLIATVVEWAELGKTVVASLIAGVGITVAFAVAILGAAQFLERRREGHAVAAAVSAALFSAAVVVCLAGVTFGLIVMVS